MYTRCPECRTPFRITRAQLAAREGMVRCGKCHAVFSASEHLLWFAPAPESAAAKEITPQRSRRGRRRPARADRRHDVHDPAIPTISALSLARPRRRLHPVAWGAINLILLAGLLAQALYFYRNELAQHEPLRPILTQYCDWLACRIEPVVASWTAPELGTTTIAPHPRFAHALRLRAVLVNRAPTPTLLPRMEIALTDSTGTVLARRIFQPREYLEAPTPDMQPNVAVTALLDITNPNGRAVGYEIQLLPPHETAPN